MKGTTLNARTNECGVVRRESDEKEGRCWAADGTTWWLDFAMHERRDGEMFGVGQSAGPHFTLRTLFSLYFTPAIDQNVIVSQFAMPHSNIYICMYITL